MAALVRRVGSYVLVSVIGCTSHRAPPATTATVTSSTSPAAAPASAGHTLQVVLEGDQVRVAGESVPTDALSLRGALARQRAGAAAAEVTLLDPKPGLVDNLVRGAAGTELQRLVFLLGTGRVEVRLTSHESSTHEIVGSSDGRQHLRSLREPPGSDDLAVWTPGNEGEERTASEKLRAACAATPCQLKVSQISGDSTLSLTSFFESWQRLSRGLPNSEIALAFSVKMGATTVSGRLPPEVIQRIVRQNFTIFRTCYEQGLARNDTLTGRVVVRFVINREGKVPSAFDGGSDIPDLEVRGCVINAFRTLEFPPPEGGIVTVVYPIMLAPG